MRVTITVVSFLFLTLPWGYASAKPVPLPCSVHPKQGTPAADLPALATISRTEAERTAVESLKASSPISVAEGELELEHGCLVYSFDLRVAGREGVEEVIIDAGTGKVLSHRHESAKREAAERDQEQKSNRQH